MEHSEEIKQAWGEFYPEFKYYLDEEGWFCKDHFQWVKYNYEEVSEKINFIHDQEFNAMVPKDIYKG